MTPASLKGRSGKNADVSNKLHKHPIIIQALKKADILSWNVFFYYKLHTFKSLWTSLQLNLTASYCLGGNAPQWLWREQNFGQFLVYDP